MEYLGASHLQYNSPGCEVNYVTWQRIKAHIATCLLYSIVFTSELYSYKAMLCFIMMGI